MMRPALRLVSTIVTLCALRAGAQGFPVKTQLLTGGVTGCAILPLPPAAPANSATDTEAQQLIAEGQDAALQGEHAQARDAFLKAQALAPRNARLAYSLAREHEALAEPAQAVRQYCRYLVLVGTAPDADDVRGRIVRLTPSSELARLEEARGNFQSGIALLRRRQYHAADSVFGSVAAAVPNAAEPLFNRALSRAARGERQNAMQDFDRYLELSPQAQDRANVRAAMARLPEGVYGPGQAFGSGLLIPGLGQMTTGRPVYGVFVLGLAGGAAALGLMQKTTIETQRHTDPFGNTYTDSVSTVSRPRLAIGAGAAAAVWLLSALEASSYARRSRSRAEAIIARDGVPERRVTLEVRALPSDRVGLGIKLR